MYKEQTISTGNVDLYVRQYGEEGQTPLLLIHGACTDCDFYADAAEKLSHLLAGKYTIYAYDRRGCARSSDPKDGEYDLAAQAKDALAILKEIGHIGEATVLGHSAGASVTMQLLKDAPEAVKKAYLFEPVLFQYLPEDDTTKEQFYDIRKLAFSKSGRPTYLRALSKFVPLIGGPDPRGRQSTEEELQNLPRDSEAYFVHEFDRIMEAKPDFDALRAAKDHITLLVGEKSVGTWRGTVVENFSKDLDLPVYYFPGAHNAIFDLPDEASWILTGLLTR